MKTSNELLDAATLAASFLWGSPIAIDRKLIRQNAKLKGKSMEKAPTERTLMFAVFMTICGQGGVAFMSHSTQDRIADQLERISETLSDTQKNLAGFTAATDTQLQEHKRRIDLLETKLDSKYRR